MIGRIRGTLVSIDGNQILVDVQGLGYELDVTDITRAGVELDKNVELYTHFVVREDAQTLYGFFSKTERDFFRVLIRINGVGPKMALGLLSGMGSGDLARNIVAENVQALVKLPGVGKKTAERLVVELKDKVTQWSGIAIPGSETSRLKEGFQMEAENALVVLGYKPQEARRLVSSVFDVSMSIEEIVKAALRRGLKQLL